MNTVKLDQLRKLSLTSGDALLSLFAPMHRTGREVQQNTITWKNTLKSARLQLEAQKMSPAQIDRRLQPASALVQQETFWQHQADGLACFVNDDQLTLLQLPISPQSAAFVGPRFHLLPVLPAINHEFRGYILACSPNRVRLLQLTEDSIEDLEPAQLPTNLQQALNIDEYVSALQHHTATAAGGKSTAIFHGHGGSDPDIKKKDELLEFFHRLDRALQDHFNGRRVQLIFAGVHSLFSIYRQANRVAQLYQDPILGNPDELTSQQLRERAQPVIRQVIELRLNNLIQQYQEKAFTDWASGDIREIQSAAALGQVDVLLLNQSFSIRGIDPNNHRNSGKSDVSDTAGTGLGIERINDIVIDTLSNGGLAFAIPPGMMPETTDIAAIFRSPAAAYVNSDESSRG